MISKDRAAMVDALLKNAQGYAGKGQIAPFDKFALPALRAGFGGTKEIEVIEQVGVAVEDLPAAGPGEIQVGDGDGPRETPVFQTTKKTLSYADSVMNDLVSVQPMTRPLGPKVVATLQTQIAK